ncbi:protein translocase subunit SecDF [Pseudopedobacter beijingensis]|uniref:Multifunctional fusion protein n=1 Tax=Pseudopedobacter beijingensis TaxID=1207056 RepID=A0ABW4IHL2_9SPHI
MQNKGLIKFATVVLSVLSLYSLSFTFFARKAEKEAKEFAQGDPVKEKNYLDSISSQPVYPIFGHNYQYVKEREMALGLDLKGGMNVTMEIDLSELLRNLANNPADPIFNEALKNAQQKLSTSREGLVSLFVSEYEHLNPDGKLAAFYSTKDNSSDIKLDDSNAKVKSYLEKQSNSAIERSYNILRTRIDKFGVTQPNIQLQLSSNRILVELPGVTDQERVRKLLQGSAKLEFFETFENHEIFPLLQNINGVLAAKQPKEQPKAAAKQDTTTAIAEGNKPALLSAKKDSTNKDSASNMASLAKANPLFSVLSPATYQGPNGEQSLRPGPVVGYAALKDTAQVNHYLNDPDIKAMIPPSVKLMWGVKSISKEAKVFELFAIKGSGVNNGAVLTGESITNAREDFDQKGNPEVTMTMNSSGAREWKRITAAAAGDPRNEDDNKCIAIVLDEMVYTAPRVGGEIPNGVSSISGNFSVEETKDLANVLKAGKLPAPAKIVSDFVVGPSLGQQAIESGLMSFVIAFVVILVFMAFYYNKAGWVANIGLVINLFFILGILTSFGFVLTLPGIAGIVLTIGLSVDANILIFERVREELALGKNTTTAIREGFKHAMPSIIDSNVTLFILGAILFIFGSGPVQGFATTLCIGIITSLFAAVLISRWIFESLIERKATITFDNNITRNAFKNLSFNFVGHRKTYYAISSIIIILGIIFYIKNDGLHLGVDFKGGRTYIVKFDQALSTEDVAKKLTEKFEGEEALVKTAGTDHSLKITTPYHISDENPDADNIVENALKKGLNELGVKYEISSSQKVTPTIASDIIYGAYGAILFSCIVMFIYILVRFKKWQYGMGAVIALFHDVLLVLSFYTILDGVMPFPLEIGQDFIAAILTVMGYTMTETVIVFDRIRERLSEHGKEDVHGEEKIQLINFALNSTLSRTILTSLTVFFVLLAIFIFGGDSIRGFIFALLIGRIIGTYSSLCISTPIVVDLSKDTKN